MLPPLRPRRVQPLVVPSCPAERTLSHCMACVKALCSKVHNAANAPVSEAQALARFLACQLLLVFSSMYT